MKCSGSPKKSHLEIKPGVAWPVTESELLQAFAGTASLPAAGVSITTAPAVVIFGLVGVLRCYLVSESKGL